MDKIVLNETPIRTTNNFGINDIVLENCVIPEDIGQFNNINVISSSSNVIMKETVENFEVMYGVSKQLISQAYENSNHELDIEFSDKNNKDNVVINYLFDEDNNKLVSKIQIVASDNTKSSVVIKYDSKDIEYGYNNLVLKVNAKKSSYLDVIVVNNLGEKLNNFMSVDVIQDDDSNVDFKFVDFGGKTSITNYCTNLKGESSKNTVNTMYIGLNERLIDINYIANLYGAKSNVDFEVQGALNDFSRKNFKGTIDFKKGAKKAEGNENESCMLLSNKAKSKSLPMLLCSEEDVVGNHSNSAGKINESQLFYLLSRGFDKKEALKLMVKAKFYNILENINDEKLKSEIIDQIDKKLS